MGDLTVLAWVPQAPLLLAPGIPLSFVYIDNNMLDKNRQGKICGSVNVDMREDTTRNH